ncbi:MAG: ABC transporter substrate-binding protein [Spirochaetia bacterium]|nr:ABC transporter substrate-binding protein [Spirochaetia bacterium]
MKKSIFVMLVILLAVNVLVAQPAMEQSPINQVRQVQFAVMAGPTGFSSVGLTLNEGRISEEVQVDMQVFPSPNEVIARLASGELDFAALPTNVAANLYNRGVKIKLAAVIGNGMLSVLSSDGSITSETELLGKTIHVPGAGSTPDQMAQLLLKQAGLVAGKDVVLDYSVAAPAQLAQLTIANKVDLVMLPQPFVSMILNRSEQAREVVDIQDLYRRLSGFDTYPMSVLVVSEKFAKNHPRALAQVLSAYKESVAWVNSDPVAAGKAIEAANIMSSAMATPAIPYCNLVFVPSQQAKQEVNAYFSFLHSFNPASLGGSVPLSDFYL